MNIIDDVWSFIGNGSEADSASNTTIRHADGYHVNSYLDLATKVAELQFRNNDLILLFRGQPEDHLNRNDNSTIKPKIFRGADSKKVPTARTLIRRFRKLERAERLFLTHYEEEFRVGKTRLIRQRLLRWAILQHYQICDTPLLDVTHSLRIAASFASESEARHAFVFVLGVPYLSGGITVSAETNLQIVRLSSVCPPTAVRPHIQEGYLLSEYPEIMDHDQASIYKPYHLDFGRRLVAKFQFNPRTFWKSDSFPPVAHNALYPRATYDPLHRLADKVRSLLEKEF